MSDIDRFNELTEEIERLDALLLQSGGNWWRYQDWRQAWNRLDVHIDNTDSDEMNTLYAEWRTQRRTRLRILSFYGERRRNIGDFRWWETPLFPRMPRPARRESEGTS